LRNINVAKPSVRSASSTERASRQRSGETLEQCVQRSLQRYFDDLDGAAPHPLYEMVTAAVERPLLQIAMARASGNQSAAAELLGINRNTLRKKLQQHKLA
jgi:Fis family transcriptional regulator